MMQIKSKIQTQNPNPKAMSKSKCQSGENSVGVYKVYDLRERLVDFAKRALRLCSRLPRLPECEVIRKQLSSSATSIGANYEEADGSLTKRDFINKMAISRKEANESRYWLKVISGDYISMDELSGDIQEAQEIRNILSAIINKSQNQ